MPKGPQGQKSVPDWLLNRAQEAEGCPACALVLVVLAIVWRFLTGADTQRRRGPMPKGPQGQKRPADVIGNAVHVRWIARDGRRDRKPPLGNGRHGPAGRSL